MKQDINPNERTLLRALIDQAVRARTATPERHACPGCGAETRDLPAPVNGCQHCYDRFWHRRTRASTR